MLPPVMGAVAFIMSDFTGIPYYLIAWYAALPALVYYLGVFALVHFEAVRLNLGRVPEEEIVGLRGRARPQLAEPHPDRRADLAADRRLFAGLCRGRLDRCRSCCRAGSARENAIGPRRFVDGCVDTCHAMVPLTAAVAAAGIIIGAIELTGLAGKFTLLLFQLSGGLLVPSLILAGVVLILLGMGMPTTAVYIMGVALLAPVFVGKFGLPTMEVHMFMLFFACLSAITPPVAVAAFAAGAIAGANPFRLAPYACKLAVGGFVLPFFFLFNRGMLLQGKRRRHPVRHGRWPRRWCSRPRSCCTATSGSARSPWLLRGASCWRRLAMAVPNPAVQYAAIACAGRNVLGPAAQRSRNRGGASCREAGGGMKPFVVPARGPAPRNAAGCPVGGDHDHG